MYDRYDDILEELIHYIEAVLYTKNNESWLEQQNKLRKNKKAEMDILNLLLEDLITEDEFSKKSATLMNERSHICVCMNELENRNIEKDYAVNKIKDIRSYFSNSFMPKGFDPELFQKVVNKVLVSDFAAIQEDEPFKLTYILGLGYDEWICEEIEDEIFDHIIIGTFLMRTGFYCFKKNGKQKDRVFIKEAKIEIAVNVPKNES